MSRTDEIFMPALNESKIPVLTLDNKWHQLLSKTEPDKQLLRLEKELNELLKRQGKANTDMKEIKKIKKKLMDEIVEMADEALSAGNKKAESKLAENKRLINECNEKIEGYEDELLFLPREIDRVNKELMLKTMESCYETLLKNKEEIEETAEWVAKVRTELKKRLIRKQEKEQWNQELYSYMHAIFGADVIDIFDMGYLQEEET